MRAELITQLTTATSIEEWNSITFGILPNEEPKGFIFLSDVIPTSNVQKTYRWAVGIAVAAPSLNEISELCLEIAANILSSFQNPVQCINGVGSVKLSGDINIEFPQSYSAQGNMSSTTGFFTAITFILEVR